MPYLWPMELSQDHQELVDFFTGCVLPAGPQHINPFSVYLDLQTAVETHIRQLFSNAEASRKAAALMLTEVRQWLTTRS